MTTTDSNGIVFLETTDNISPFHTLINTLQTGTSTAITSVKNSFPKTAGGITYSGATNTFVAFPYPLFSGTPVIVLSNADSAIKPLIVDGDAHGFTYHNEVSANATLHWLAWEA